MGTNTGIGIGIGIPFKNNALGGDRPYLPPELKARLIGVWDNYGKKNTDADRNIIKNKIPNAGGDLEILNAAYKLNSGFGEYKEDFTSWRICPNIEVTDNVITTNGNFNSTWFIYKHANENEINEMNIKVSGIPEGGIIRYFYIPDETATIPVSYNISEDGVYHLPKSKLSSNRVSIGFTVSSSYDWNNIRIEQLSDFGGAFVTDGVNDLITSTKTVQEMLGGSTEFTAVSMIHLISPGQDVDGAAYTNYIRTSDNYWTSNRVSNVGKTGIYGYSFKQGTPTVINNILGDKNDYTTEKSDIVSDSSVSDLFRAKFSVEGFEHVINGAVHVSSVAWYWTIIANKVLTTDQINQVIAYFNLDRTLKPDILCDVKKQGITNENHAEFGDKLIDFSGNGRDIQLNNIAWKGDSGIGKYATDLSDTRIWTRSKGITSSPFSFSYNGLSGWILFANTELTNSTDMPSFKIQIKGLLEGQELIYRYYDSTGNSDGYSITKDGEYTLPSDIRTAKPETSRTTGFQVVKNEANIITITQIPSHAGALCLDGVNDFGKTTGMPIYKDYTVITDYERISGIEQAWAEALISKSYIANQGAFVLMETNGMAKHSYSFGAYTTFNKDDSTRTLLYQSKYKCGDVDLNAGTGIDGDTLWLGTYRDNYSSFFNGAIYSLMSFPYTMSKFLIERQLKKHKLGTLYPNMVEFRPVIKANANYKIFYTAMLPLTGDIWERINIGDYVPVGRRVAIQLSFDNEASELVSAISSQLGNISITKNSNNKGYTIFGDILKNKSPQKINITIDEYIRYEDIVQPYPVLLRFNDENGNEVSWGGKFRVGSTITRIGNFYENNLLDGLYVVRNPKLNGNNLITPTYVVEKSMVFTCDTEYLLDNNEPKCILSPSRLRIPNSSYKILGYIPDISGHGNHGVIHNSAYEEESGANEDGSYQFDGVDDFVTIPTLFSGGKQVLMKVNWDKTIADAILYDQRGYPNEFAIYNADVDNNNNPVFAYQARNNGQTYIDGILNKNIKASELRAITHNITITNELSTGTNTSSPVIGSNRVHDAYFTNMALYDFMLFDNISTDDKIKELNEYVGIEAKVELPPYYWDAYGKTNLDADKATIQQRGVAIGDYDLTNYNHAYEGMSGYNGYPVVFGANKTWERLSGVYGYTSDVTNTTIHVTHVERASNGLLFSYVKEDGALANIKEIPAFRVTIGGLEGNSKFGYRYLATEDATVETLVYLGNGTHELAKSFAPTEALLDLTRDAWVGILISPMVEGELVFDCDITIEVLPEYENGLAYDGITDYSKNANIPVLTDYTYIYKRTIINIPTNAATLLKGADKTNGGAFIADYGNKWQFNFGQYNTIQGIADGINWQTVNSFNGTSINKGENTDDSGITVAKFSNGYTSMVFYKLILYPKTISLLEINFLKNLMEKDEIIDLNNPIFIKNE